MFIVLQVNGNGSCADDEVVSHDDNGANGKGAKNGGSSNGGSGSAGNIISDLFEAEYRSTLKCPSCQKQSSNYDPFLCVSLPIPQKCRIPVAVTVVRLSQSSPRQRRMARIMNTADTVQDLRQWLTERSGIPLHQVSTSVYVCDMCKVH